MNDKPKDNSVYILHILDAIGQIGEYLKNSNPGKFEHDRMLFDAVIRQFEIIGEAAKRVSDDFRDLHSEIPWQKMISMRNFLAHEYFNIKPRVIWDTAKNHLPPLKAQLVPLLKEK